MFEAVAGIQTLIEGAKLVASRLFRSFVPERKSRPSDGFVEVPIGRREFRDGDLVRFIGGPQKGRRGVVLGVLEEKHRAVDKLSGSVYLLTRYRVETAPIGKRNRRTIQDVLGVDMVKI